MGISVWPSLTVTVSLQDFVFLSSALPVTSEILCYDRESNKAFQLGWYRLIWFW